MFRDKAGNLSIGRIILAAVVLVALIALVGSSFTVIPAGTPASYSRSAV